jgi:hypothetical protein
MQGRYFARRYRIVTGPSRPEGTKGESGVKCCQVVNVDRLRSAARVGSYSQTGSWSNAPRVNLLPRGL